MYEGRVLVVRHNLGLEHDAFHEIHGGVDTRVMRAVRI